MIRLKDFTIGYGKKILLKEINTLFPDSSLTALIGRNGTGKSTLLRAIAGLNPKYYGEILINDRNLKSLSQKELASVLSFVNTQRPRISNLTCNDIISLGRSPFTGWTGRLSEKDSLMIEEALENVGMKSYRNRQINSLSDGEFQRVMIARAIAQDTPVIILDEPTSFLDLPTRFEVVGLLKRLSSEKGKTVIFSTHELDIAVEMADYIALIDDQNLLNLPVKEMISQGHIRRLFEIPGDYINRLLQL